ncbi:MAG: hypothetical protein N3D73_00640 [Candidatus Diapherotrites archaeon]|nr:hypothetical protein [Candidatus Diapherotrites archaeon]
MKKIIKKENVLMILKDALLLLIKEPKLFIPKLLVSFLYSIVILVIPPLTISSFSTPSLELLKYVLFFMLFTILVAILDICINALYPFLVAEYFRLKKISFINAFHKLKERFVVAFFSPFLVEFFSMLIVIILAFSASAILFFLGKFAFFLSLLISLLVIFVISIIFYFIYPVASLEKFNLFSAIKNSIDCSKKNIKLVSKLALFSVFLSLLTFLLSFTLELSHGTLEKTIFFLIFVILRFFIAIISTYIYVLSPVSYVKYIK